MRKKRVMIIIGLLFFALIARFSANEAHAAMNLDGVFYQNLINWMPYCYNYALISSGITIPEYNENGKLKSLFRNGWGANTEVRPDHENGETIYIPSIDIGSNKINEVSKVDNGRAINCYAAFAGDKTGSLAGSMVGLLEKYGVDTNNASETLEKMGFEADSSGGSASSNVSYCYHVYDSGNTTVEKHVGVLCKNAADYPLKSGYDYRFTIDISDYTISPQVDNDGDGFLIWLCRREVTCSSFVFSSEEPKGGEEYEPNIIGGQNDLTSSSVRITREEGLNTAMDSQKYKKTNGNIAVERITGGTASVKDFTSADKYNLYVAYLKENYGFTGVSNECVDSKPAMLADTAANDYYIWSSGQWCFAVLDMDLVGKEYNMTVFANNQKRKLNKVITTLSDLINLMGDLDYSDGDFDSVVTLLEEDDEDSGSKKATCKNSTGAKSLGWIVCPILDLVSSAVDGIYTNYVEPNLQLSPRLFGNVQNSDGGTQFGGTYEAWVTFRDFANVVFIVLLLIVIFSQLTGIGIDNYGIKKILPKLIVAAILINLSYILCMILVDISNIVGSGVQSILNGLGKDISGMSFGISGEGNGVGDSNYTLQGSAVTAVAILAAIGTVGAILANPAILLSLFVSAIGIFVAIFFLFVLLAAREATIIVLVILSPLAFVCYMLPNTKKMFDRWWKLFEGLLLVYPIAGLMVGGGNYVSKLLMATGFADESQGGSFVTAFTAMMVGIIPIFFIPMVLKSSFAAMGKVGGMLTGLGAKASGTASSKIRGSEGYKNAQRMGLEHRTRVRAGLNKNGQLSLIGRGRAALSSKMAGNTMRGPVGWIGRTVGTSMQRNQAANMGTAKRTLGEVEASSATLSGAMARTGISKAGATLGFEKGTESAYYGKQFLDAAKSKNTTGMNAAISAMKNSGMKNKEIAKVVREAYNQGGMSGMDANTRTDWFRQLSNKYGDDFLATDYELKQFAQSGGNMNGGNLGNYGDLFKSGEIEKSDIKSDDVTRLSGDSLAAMATSGYLSSGMAQQILDSGANLSGDKQIMVGAAADGAIKAGSDAAQFKKDANDLLSQPSGQKQQTQTIDGTAADLDTKVKKWTSPAAKRVEVVGGGQGGGTLNDGVSINLRHLDDNSLLDIATNPGTTNNNPLRQAAENEYSYREKIRNQGRNQNKS